MVKFLFSSSSDKFVGSNDSVSDLQTTVSSQTLGCDDLLELIELETKEGRFHKKLETSNT